MKKTTRIIRSRNYLLDYCVLNMDLAGVLVPWLCEQLPLAVKTQLISITSEHSKKLI